MADWDKPFTVLRSDTGIDVVVLRGEIDHHLGAPRLDRTLSRLVSRIGAKILLDFRDVTYCCSTGIATILDAAEEVRESGGVLVCAAVSGSAREPMDILNIPNVVPFFISVAEALEAMEEGAVNASSSTSVPGDRVL